MTRYTRITGTGSFLPARRVSNDELAAELAARGIETSDAWITERTGIRARHFADPATPASQLAVPAAQAAMQAAGAQPQDIDLLIVATSTPDMVFPATAAIVQRQLGIAGSPAFDVQAVCSGFIYALTVADAMIRAGGARRALVIGAEVFSRILDFNDRTTCVLFGDGAGAVVLEASDTPGILATDLHADGRHVDILCVPGHVSGGHALGTPLLHMDGQAVFKAQSPPGQFAHHARHGQKTRPAARKNHRHPARARQHLRRFHSAGAGPRRAQRPSPPRPNRPARRRGRRLYLGFRAADPVACGQPPFSEGAAANTDFTRAEQRAGAKKAGRSGRTAGGQAAR